MKILVSACLLGVNCRYCGDGCLNLDILALAQEHQLIPICPEIYGGLPTPREPAERVGKRVINKQGEDVTNAFNKGAEETLKLAKLLKVDGAILKKRSPSCGQNIIYDGTFTGTLTSGDGVTVEALKEMDIFIYDEESFKTFFNK